MKLLKDILYGARITDIKGNTNIAIEAVEFDSRNPLKYGLFVAVRGTQVDGHTFISKSISNGALAVVCEELPTELLSQVTYVQVADSVEALGVIAANFYDNPSSKLKLVGVTGTNGKTTTATLLYRLFRKMGYKVGLLSTVVNKIHNEDIPSTHTTPDVLQLNQLLDKMVEKGCTHCFMEVSSHAIHQKRIAGVEFDGAVFTNITREHLDYHKTFDEYIHAKKAFFDALSASAFSLVNKDDKHGETMVQNTKSKIKTYGIRSMADFKAKIIENQFTGLQLNIDGHEVWSKLIGGFNAYNLLTVYAVAMLLEEDQLTVLTSISGLENVDGRFEYIKTENDITAIVDYAHTPDALLNVLKTIKDIRSNNELVITVVGCGGDRDKGKRPEMAAIACDYSEKVIFTSDNPRTEDPDAIIDDMQKGVEPQHFKKTAAIPSRKEAIKMACSMARPGDIILVAGKGHEKYQEIKGERFPFDDMQELNETLKLLEK